MRIQRSLPSLLVLFSLLISVLLAGCGQQPGNPTTTSEQSPLIDMAAPEIVLTNPTPDQLSVTLNIMYGVYDSPDYDTASVSLLFSSQERNVQFAGQEQLICNNQEIALPRESAAQGIILAENRSRDLAGQHFSCTYSANQTKSTFAFTLPQAATILTPSDQAQVQRSNNTIVEFSHNTQMGELTSIVALMKDGSKAFTSETLSGTQTALDTSNFPTGEGQITLTQEFLIETTQTDTPFHSLSSSGQAQITVFVTWI